MPFIVPKFDTQTVLTVAACIGGGAAVLYYTSEMERLRGADRAELDRLRAAEAARCLLERYDSTKAQAEVWDEDAMKRAFSFFDGMHSLCSCVTHSTAQRMATVTSLPPSCNTPCTIYH